MSSPDRARFTPYRESLFSTLARTGGIAIVVSLAICLGQFHHFPASTTERYHWLVLFASISWISFGGHWVELAYLNGLRPQIASWSDRTLVLVRLGTWIVGGTILFLAAAATRQLLLNGRLPGHVQIASILLFGGLIFAAIELVPHTFLQLAGRPSFWNCRG